MPPQFRSSTDTMLFVSFTTAKTLARYHENTLPEQTFYQGAPGVAVVARPGTGADLIRCVPLCPLWLWFWIASFVSSAAEVLRVPLWLWF